MRALFVEYVDLRIDVARQEVDLATAMPRAGKLQDELWTIARDAARADPASIPLALFLQSMNEVIDLQTKRVVAAVRTRIPRVVWSALFFLAAIALLGVGYHAGLVGSTQIVPLSMLVLSFGTVVLLIANLDRPNQGLIDIDQGPLEEVLQSLSPPG